MCATTDEAVILFLLDYVVSGRVEPLACAKYDKELAGGRKVEGSKSDQAIVVNTVLKNGASVVLLDKATSGINGARTQREKDSTESSDTLMGGAKKPELAKLRKLSSFQCAKRCKSRTLRSAAKRELRGVTLLISVHSAHWALRPMRSPQRESLFNPEEPGGDLSHCHCNGQFFLSTSCTGPRDDFFDIGLNVRVIT